LTALDPINWIKSIRNLLNLEVVFQILVIFHLFTFIVFLGVRWMKQLNNFIGSAKKVEKSSNLLSVSKRAEYHKYCIWLWLFRLALILLNLVKKIFLVIVPPKIRSPKPWWAAQYLAIFLANTLGKNSIPNEYTRTIKDQTLNKTTISWICES